MINESRRLRTAIVGCGHASETLHIPALRRLSGVEVVALVDPNRQALQRVASRFGIGDCFTELDPVLGDPSVDMVAVCVPPALHVETALHVLDAGKHVLVEKPLALSLEDCDRLVDRAEAVDAKVMVGFMLRFHRLVRTARAFIRDGSLGSIEAIRTNWTSPIGYRQQLPAWRNRPETGGGVLFEIAVHHFDLWRYLLDTEVEEVFTLSRSKNFPNETASVTARLANGAVATGFFSDCTSDGNELEIYGRNGRLRVSLYRYAGFEFIPTSATQGLAARLRELKKSIMTLATRISILRQGGDFCLAYRDEWKHFTDVVRHNVPVEPLRLQTSRTAEASE